MTDPINKENTDFYDDKKFQSNTTNITKININDLDNIKFQFRSNSQLKTFKSCPRRYFFNYRQELRGTKKALALDFGKAWHKAMDKLWFMHCIEKIRDENEIVRSAFNEFLISWKKSNHPYPIPIENEKEYLPRTPGVALEMLYSYYRTRQIYLDKITLISTEEPFAVPIDPDDPAKFYVGYIDKVIIDEGRYWVIEHKTTTLYSIAAGFQTRYIESFDPDSQIDGYGYALQMLYPDKKPMGVIIDAVLVHKDHHNISKFIPVNKSSVFANDWLEDTLYWWEKIDESIKENIFPKNVTSCFEQFGVCPFRNLCIYTPNINQMPSDNPGYIKETHESFPYAEAEKAIRKAFQARIMMDEKTDQTEKGE